MDRETYLQMMDEYRRYLWSDFFAKWGDKIMDIVVEHFEAFPRLATVYELNGLLEGCSIIANRDILDREKVIKALLGRVAVPEKTITEQECFDRCQAVADEFQKRINTEYIPITSLESKDVGVCPKCHERFVIPHIPETEKCPEKKRGRCLTCNGTGDNLSDPFGEGKCVTCHGTGLEMPTMYIKPAEGMRDKIEDIVNQYWPDLQFEDASDPMTQTALQNDLWQKDKMKNELIAIMSELRKEY